MLSEENLKEMLLEIDTLSESIRNDETDISSKEDRIEELMFDVSDYQENFRINDIPFIIMNYNTYYNRVTLRPYYTFDSSEDIAMSFGEFATKVTYK